MRCNFPDKKGVYLKNSGHESSKTITRTLSFLVQHYR